MKVSELASKLNTTSATILHTLKSLKLKAKDSKQELSAAVISVVKSEFSKGKIKTIPEAESSKKATKSKGIKKKTAAKDEKVEKVEKVVKKKAVKKKAVKEKADSTKTVKAKKAVDKSKIEDKKESKTIKKETAVKETIRTKKKISKDPVITLKPLTRKKRRVTTPSHDKKRDGGVEGLSVKSETVIEENSVESSSMTETSKQPQDKSNVKEQPVETPGIPRDESLPDLEIRVPITVKDFSTKIQQKPSMVLTKLMKMGVFAHINQSLDRDIVDRLTREFGFNLAKIKTQEEQLIETHQKDEENPELLKARAPVVTFMGHVDHGKTSLLDRIRKSKVADTEHGGITQHIGAYSVKLPNGRITFLDTPGHEAFTAMRARGAHITDLVVIVIAADEGIMPQTEEAIDHARAAEVPIIIALNKIDRKTADVERVKKQLMERNLTPEDWGGKTVVANVSAMTGEGIDGLLEMILLEAELLELKANPSKAASGIVVDAHLSKGKGTIATLIIQSGTLKEGDMIVAGAHYGKIKAVFDDHERAIKNAGPSMPVEVLGLPDIPEAGEKFYVVEDEKQAREIALKRQEQIKHEKLHSKSKITLEDLYSQIEEGAIKELNVIIKADVQGSLEALIDSLEKIPNQKVKIRFIHTGIGDINASDVLLAVASRAIVIGFHVGIGPKAKSELEKQPVDVRQYRIIYDVVDDLRKALEGLLDTKIKKKFLSRIEVREVFKLTKQGMIAGCFVTKGKVIRKVKVDVIRNGEIIHSDIISSLKRFKDDVKEVTEGMECGISLEKFSQYEKGDIFETYEEESIAQKL
ncbi:MAG: translation initiation factor IF-2 [Candidatus Omnitrophica bacterium]|nr:translation initiation factor IF-2 [Candidatus Omnitrophota bacterium]MCB9746886.1 translation initiation factor IF-2 [Candidatus Omnitrophota bacterium]